MNSVAHTRSAIRTPRITGYSDTHSMRRVWEEEKSSLPTKDNCFTLDTVYDMQYLPLERRASKAIKVANVCCPFLSTSSRKIVPFKLSSFIIVMRLHLRSTGSLFLFDGIAVDDLTTLRLGVPLSLSRLDRYC